MKKVDPELVLELIIEILGLKNCQNSVQIHEPDFVNTNALNYLRDCIESNWVSSSGKWVDKFEKEISTFTGAPEVISITNGTDALRLAFYIMGVKPNDEVLVPSLTFVGTANAISHLGAIPHFVDIEKSTLGIDPILLNNYLENISTKSSAGVINKQTGRKISAICPVHIFGNPSDCVSIKKISDQWSIPVVEDAAEALGSFIGKTHCGLLGDIGVISFNGNKIITTGGGGALITKDKNLANKARHLSTTAKLKHPWEFFHDEIAWNDRLPNLNAALGVSQLENLKTKLALKNKLFLKYCEAFKNLSNIDILKNNLSDSVSNNWLVTLKINLKNSEDTKNFRNKLLEISHQKGILLRPIWKPLHHLPIYKNNPRDSLKVTDNIANRLVNLPSSPQLVK
tara:strand:+ start:6569 stop:7762 length:1194 start_codon:yes stop_codon:yes gene_type:complete